MEAINRLATETSPYLLQHADHPVAWQAWSEAALALARAENRPILLSIGYSACHWCHVMAHESFEDAATADVMNRLFVNIKAIARSDPYCKAVAEGIVGWLRREMTSPEGAFYSSLDADSEHEEGKFYVWDRAQVALLLSPQESALAGRHWGLDQTPNFEGREHGGFFFTAHDHEALIQRPKTAHDNALPAGNGVAALALLRLGDRLGEARYPGAARRTLRAFATQLSRQPGGCASLIVALDAEMAVNPPVCKNVMCGVPTSD